MIYKGHNNNMGTHTRMHTHRNTHKPPLMMTLETHKQEKTMPRTKTWKKIKMIKCKQTKMIRNALTHTRRTLSIYRTLWRRRERDYHNNMIMNVKWVHKIAYH